jgi:hypothetical protein
VGKLGGYVWIGRDECKQCCGHNKLSYLQHSPNPGPMHVYLFRLPHLPSVLVLVVALPGAPIHCQQVYSVFVGDAESIDT